MRARAPERHHTIEDIVAEGDQGRLSPGDAQHERGDEQPGGLSRDYVHADCGPQDCRRLVQCRGNRRIRSDPLAPSASPLGVSPFLTPSRSVRPCATGMGHSGMLAARQWRTEWS
jgi:hypothetical protein